MIRRFKTREVKVGQIGIGGQNPIRIQSMTNTQTMDTEATVEQSIRMFSAGCELVRITAPGIKEAKNLAVIKSELINRGFTFPLIADIHYSPKAAEVAAGIVEKVRINPGNYTDRNRGKINFSDAEYRASLENIRKNLSPLIEICKSKGTAIRIGSNHGSLSDRIMDRFGDTPEGMVESAMEFARIFRDMDFHNFIFSMKSSNTRVMVYATRLLVKKMMGEGMDYPIHLGVTEAGNDIEGRIKSAIGIGTLLSNGIGDTIRVSLTENPENEIPVARKIVDYINKSETEFSESVFDSICYSPFAYNPRKSFGFDAMPESKMPVVIGDDVEISAQQPDMSFDQLKSFNLFETNTPISRKSIKPGTILLLKTSASPATKAFREVFETLYEEGLKNPVILQKNYDSAGTTLAIEAAIDFGPLFLDGSGDGICIKSPKARSNELVSLSFDILQSSGARISKTEFIACPSCGRTQYDIQASLKKIKAATSHLTGLKIAVMGCIVNGPGEMADADYGYVGMGSGKVALYKGKTQVIKNVDQENAVEALIEIIKEAGDWITPRH